MSKYFNIQHDVILQYTFHHDKENLCLASCILRTENTRLRKDYLYKHNNFVGCLTLCLLKGQRPVCIPKKLEVRKNDKYAIKEIVC